MIIGHSPLYAYYELLMIVNSIIMELSLMVIMTHGMSKCILIPWGHPRGSNQGVPSNTMPNQYYQTVKKEM